MSNHKINNNDLILIILIVVLVLCFLKYNVNSQTRETFLNSKKITTIIIIIQKNFNQ